MVYCEIKARYQYSNLEFMIVIRKSSYPAVNVVSYLGCILMTRAHVIIETYMHIYTSLHTFFDKYLSKCSMPLVGLHTILTHLNMFDMCDN